MNIGCNSYYMFCVFHWKGIKNGTCLHFSFNCHTFYRYGTAKFFCVYDRRNNNGVNTEENNLQTLCWKCNRNKSDKIFF
ncbi:MAG: HNH endonuclease [Oribacterium sp.]|nr:HNH endonuclease [Oribacterium sp.]